MIKKKKSVLDALSLADITAPVPADEGQPLTDDAVEYDIDPSYVPEVAPPSAQNGYDFTGYDVLAVAEHAVGLKSVLDDAGNVDPNDPMFADYVAEYAAAQAYLANFDIVV